MTRTFRLLAIALSLAVILTATFATVAFADGDGNGACLGETSEGEGPDLENQWGNQNEATSGIEVDDSSGPMGPAPNSHDGEPDGSGFEGPNGPNGT